MTRSSSGYCPVCDFFTGNDLCDECETLPNCDKCGGEGSLYSGHPNDPHPRLVGPCDACKGSGKEFNP